MSYFSKFKGSYFGSWWGAVATILSLSIAGTCDILSRFASYSRCFDLTAQSLTVMISSCRTFVSSAVLSCSVNVRSLNAHINDKNAVVEVTDALLHRSNDQMITQINQSNSLITSAKEGTLVASTTVSDL